MNPWINTFPRQLLLLLLLLPLLLLLLLLLLLPELSYSFRLDTKDSRGSSSKLNFR